MPAAVADSDWDYNSGLVMSAVTKKILLARKKTLRHEGLCRLNPRVNNIISLQVRSGQVINFASCNLRSGTLLGQKNWGHSVALEPQGSLGYLHGIDGIIFLFESSYTYSNPALGPSRVPLILIWFDDWSRFFLILFLFLFDLIWRAAENWIDLI